MEKAKVIVNTICVVAWGAVLVMFFSGEVIPKFTIGFAMGLVILNHLKEILEV